jgi:putative ABC transport system permease protein
LPDPPVVYLPLAQMPTPNVALVIRTRPGTSAATAAVRHVVGELDPNLPLGPVASMEQIRDSTFSGVSRPASLLVAFASIAVLLSAVGLYGVVSYSVTQRRRELGIRVALGARAENVFSGVLGNALAMVGIGLVAGLAGVYALTRTLASLLFEVSPLDPVSLVIACFSMLAIGALAGFFPARRAARLDVMISLRDA